MNPRQSTGDFEQALAAQCERLERLRSSERELEAIKQDEAELEVEKISADVALQSATAKNDFGIDSTDATVIAGALARKRDLDRAMLPPDESPTGENAGGQPEAEQLRAGIAALNDWLRAAATVAGWRRPRAAYAIVGVACLATIGAAMTLHVMLLVLLVPLVMALGYLAFTDRDADWIRLGAVRRFGQTMLPPPPSWEKSAVESRITELESGLADAEARRAETCEMGDAQASEPAADDASEMALAMELVEVSDQLDAALRKAGIDPASIDGELAGWLQQVHAVHRIGNALAETRKRRKSLGRLAEENREAIFRFLALNDAAPPGGRADVASLDAGLRRLADRNKGK